MDKSKPNYFLAVSLPQFIQKRIHQYAVKLEQKYPFKSWVSLGDYHITLVFLGKIDTGYLTELEQELSPVIEQHPAFHITVDRIGSFGKEEQPRVLWNGVVANKTLHMLQGDLYRKCAEFAFHLDERPFRPHITLARKWNGRVKLKPSELEGKFNMGAKACSWTANEVVLYRSRSKQTPMYQQVYKFSLNEK